MSRTRHKRKRTEPNPLVPRLQHIAKTYDPFVTMSTFGAWAEATGAHGLREHMARIFHAERIADREQAAAATARAIQMMPRFAKDWRAPLDTRFDRYLPWLAREINRDYKPYRKLARKLDFPDWPPGYDLADRTVSTSRQAILPPQELIGPLHNAAIRARQKQDLFRVVVDWAEAEGVDLGPLSWDEAMREASEWVEEGGHFGDVAQGTVVYELDDGWTVQELTTTEQFEDEGRVMQHCVDGYDPSRVGIDYRIFSLRDPKGHPHATMEWSVAGSYAEQLKGKQNREPELKYLLPMIAFRRDYVQPKYSHARKLTEYTPGVLARFGEAYQGAWATNPGGNPLRLIGGFGAVEEAMENDLVYLVYEWDGVWRPYGLDDLVKVIGNMLEEVEECPSLWDAEQTEEERDEWVQHELGRWVAETYIQRAGKDLAHPDHVPALEFPVWADTAVYPADKHDEMVEEMDAEGLEPHDKRIPKGRVVEETVAANPRRRAARPDAGMLALKRKLMR